MKRDKPQKLSGFLSQGIMLVLCLAIIVFVVGCGHSDTQLKILEMCKETTQKYNPADIRKSVLPLFVKYKHPYENGGQVVPIDEIPNVIKSLPFYSGDTNWIETSWVGTDGQGLMFVTGSGDGHWGIIVCKNESDLRIGVGSRYGTTPWTNGIYFYSEFR
jgi:hypothetical protein